jgi:RHS repeat-associated protein
MLALAEVGCRRPAAPPCPSVPVPSHTTTTLPYGICATGAGGRAPNLGIEWDAENRLLAVKQGSTTLASFTYNGSGKRVTKTAGSATHTYIYDAEDIVEEFIVRELLSGGNIKYFHGPGIDQPLAKQEVSGMVIEPIVSYYVADHLGSIARVTNAAGVPVLSQQYDPWGNLTEGATADGYSFTGREWDPETGLYYYRARYYDPKIGRFISEDPIGFDGGINFFAYVANSPAIAADPSGLTVQRCCRPLSVNPAVNFGAQMCGLQHCFITTGTQTGGMGPANPNDPRAQRRCPIGTPTRIIPHPGQSASAQCADVPNVDEECVNKILRSQHNTGPWGPSNNCNTLVAMIIAACSKGGGQRPPPRPAPTPRPCGHCSTQ